MVFANGFLSEAKSGWGEWEPIIRRRYPDSPVYRLRWGAKEKRDLGALFIGRSWGEAAVGGARQGCSAQRDRHLKRIGLIGGALTIAELAKNPWWVARTRANMTGAVLADLIARTDVPRTTCSSGTASALE